jgi:hypothetical protein
MREQRKGDEKQSPISLLNRYPNTEEMAPFIDQGPLHRPTQLANHHTTHTLSPELVKRITLARIRFCIVMLRRV